MRIVNIHVLREVERKEEKKLCRLIGEGDGKKKKGEIDV